MTNPKIVLLGLANALVVATVTGVMTYYASISAIKTEISISKVIEAYAYYLSTASDPIFRSPSSTLTDDQSILLASARGRLVQAKGLILLHGSNDVIKKLAVFETSGKPCEGDLFLSMIQAMKNHVGENLGKDFLKNARTILCE